MVSNLIEKVRYEEFNNFISTYAMLLDDYFLPLLWKAEEGRQQKLFYALSDFCGSSYGAIALNVVDPSIYLAKDTEVTPKKATTALSESRLADSELDNLTLKYVIVIGYASGRGYKYCELDYGTQIMEDVEKILSPNPLEELDKSAEKLADGNGDADDILNVYAHPERIVSKIKNMVADKIPYKEIKDEAEVLGEHAPHNSKHLWELLVSLK